MELTPVASCSIAQDSRLVSAADGSCTAPAVSGHLPRKDFYGPKCCGAGLGDGTTVGGFVLRAGLPAGGEGTIVDGFVLGAGVLLRVPAEG